MFGPAVCGVLLASVGVAESGGELLAKAASLLLGRRGKEAFEIVQTRWAAGGKEIPPNHDLEQTIRLGELTATFFVVTQCRRRWEGENFDTRSAAPPPFIAKATKWVERQLGFCATLKTVGDGALVAELEGALDTILPASRAEVVREALDGARQRVWKELVEGARKPSEDFEPFFLGSDNEPGWPLVFQAFMREALKANPRAEIAFVTSRLAVMRTMLAGVRAKLDEIGAIAKATKEDTAAIRAEQATKADIDGLRRLIKEIPHMLAAAAAEQEGVRERELIEPARRIAADAEDFDQARGELERAVEVAIEVQRDGRQGSNAGDFVDLVLKRVAELSRESKFDEGAQVAQDSFAQWQAEEEERRQAAAQQGVTLARAGLNQDLLRRDAASAAAWVARIVDLETPAPAARFEALRQVFMEWYERWCIKGLNLDLEVSIAIARLCLSRASDPDERAAALNDLSNALQALGERESGTARLEEAVAAFRAALDERTRERLPLDWATTTGNLGVAMVTIAERTGDLAVAETAQAEIETAHAAMEAAGHGPYASTYEGQLPRARALVARLRGG